MSNTNDDPFDKQFHDAWNECERLRQRRIKFKNNRYFYLKLYGYFKFIYKITKVYHRDPWKYG